MDDEGDRDEVLVTQVACYSKAIRFEVMVGAPSKQRCKAARKQGSI